MIADVPLAVRVQLAHAAVAHVADAAGLDLLHLKGPALDSSLRWPGRNGSDADVLARPSEASMLVRLLEGRGWTVQTLFAANSSFEHAATLHHATWGFADVHRWYPGITLEPEAAFERLWRDRRSVRIAGRRCWVPSLPAQALLQVLHAARPSNPVRARRDLQVAWEGAPGDLRRDVVRLVQAFGADVAFAAATGHLDEYRHHPHYLRWRVASRGGTRVEEWVGRVRAAPSRRAAVRVALRAPLVNTEHLAVLLGRRPTRREVAAELVARYRRAAVEEWQSRRRGPAT